MKTTLTYKNWITIIISIAALAAPIWALYNSEDGDFRVVKYLFNGAVFAERPIITGGSLDQPSLHKEYFIFCYSLVILCPCLALVRWLNRRNPRPIRLLFAMASLPPLIHPLSILTIFTWDVSRYTYHMGTTPKRLIALAVALVSYLTLALFAVWIGRLKPQKTVQSIDLCQNDSGAGRPV